MVARPGRSGLQPEEVERLTQTITKMVRGRVHTPGWRDDAAQECWLRVLKAVEKYNGVERRQLEFILISVVRNAICSFLRHQRVRSRIETSHPVEFFETRPKPQERESHSAASLHKIKPLLAQLPFPDNVVLTEFFFPGPNTLQRAADKKRPGRIAAQDVAFSLGISPATVSRIVARNKEKIGLKLGEWLTKEQL